MVGPDAIARIPTVMMWDDHDIFDGWGSYSPAMQHCELFKVMMRHARKAFWVFQMQHALADLPPLQASQHAHVSPQDPQYQPIQWGAPVATQSCPCHFLRGNRGSALVTIWGPYRCLLLICVLNTLALRYWVPILGAPCKRGSTPFETTKRCLPIPNAST
ncbi:hypothetical protein [Pseudomonas sp. NPDC086251]|uniref:hypothetical protein n=1 Tax=Pseudomonas sp. NPDC086251 TaxID=3364431 RepID=UPI00383245C8